MAIARVEVRRGSARGALREGIRLIRGGMADVERGCILAEMALMVLEDE